MPKINARTILLLRLMFAVLTGAAALLIPTDGDSFFHALYLSLLVAACLIAGAEIPLRAIQRAVKSEFFNDDLFFSISVVLAWVLAGARQSVLFCVLVYQVGGIFFKIAESRASRSISHLSSLIPATAAIRFGDGVKSVPVREVRVGERVVIEPGERIPLDGVIIRGDSSLNTFAVTGGVEPLRVGKGSSVLAGCTNLENTIVVETRETVTRSTVSRLLDWVGSGRNESDMEKWTRRLAFFLPLGLIAAAVFVYLVPILFHWKSMALQRSAITLLAIACPASLTLTVPKLFKAGVAKATSFGVLFRDQTSFEQLAKVTTAYIEHNGALTKGEYRVTSVEPEELPELALLRLAASAINNPHCVMPIHKLALAERYSGKLDESSADEARSMHGGIVVDIKGNTVAVGDAELMFEENIRTGDDSGAKDIIYVAVNGKYAGRICFADALRPDAAETVYRLQSADVKTVLFTDELLDEAKETARSLGFDKLYRDMTRTDKKRLLQLSNTAYVGLDFDLLNSAEVGITMEEPGPELLNKPLKQMPSVTVFSESVLRISDAHRLSRSVVEIAQTNFTVTFAVKAIIVLLAILGWCPFWAAIAAETVVKYFCGSRKI